MSEATIGRAPLPDWWWAQTVQIRRIIAGAVATLIALLVVFLGVRLLGGSSSILTVAEAQLFVLALPAEQVERWDALADCESGGDWSLDTGNGYFGGLQIQQVTWDGVGGTGLPSATSREEQIMRSEDIRELQGWGAWPRCSAQLGFAD